MNEEVAAEVIGHELVRLPCKTLHFFFRNNYNKIKSVDWAFQLSQTPITISKNLDFDSSL